MKKPLCYRWKKPVGILSAAAGVITGAILLLSDYIDANVPWFIRASGLKYSIHYLQGKDAWDEVYEEIGVGKRRAE